MTKQQTKEIQATWQKRLTELEQEMTIIKDKLKMAQLDGDLSENADWKILNEKLESLRGQIFAWKRQYFLWDKTQVDRLINYRVLATGEEKTVTLTSEWQSDPSQGKISLTSPLGLTLLNKKVGEISEVRTKEQVYQIQIISIIE